MHFCPVPPPRKTYPLSNAAQHLSHAFALLLAKNETKHWMVMDAHALATAGNEDLKRARKAQVTADINPLLDAVRYERANIDAALDLLSKLLWRDAEAAAATTSGDDTTPPTPDKPVEVEAVDEINVVTVFGRNIWAVYRNGKQTVNGCGPNPYSAANLVHACNGRPVRLHAAAVTEHWYDKVDDWPRLYADVVPGT